MSTQEHFGSIFDDVFRTIAQKMPQLLIPLINLAFGTAYPEDIPFVQMRNEHLEKNGRIITDSILKIQGIIYHIECESRPDRTTVMVLRMVEYDFAIAFEEGWNNQSRELQLPSSCVVYLRHTKNTPDHLHLTLRNAEGDSMPYRVRTIKAQEMSMDSIFEKNLLLLLPYYVMRYEKQYADIEKDDIRLNQFLLEIEDLTQRMTGAANYAEKAEVYTNIGELVIKISDYMLQKYDRMREGVEEIVGGKVLTLMSERLREEGQIICCAGLVRDGLLSLADAAARLGLTIAEFSSRAENLGYPVQ